MMLTNSREFATALAALVQKKFSSQSRGALLIRCLGDGNLIVGIFGNDHYLADIRSRQEVELLRRHLKPTPLHELGFGLSPDGNTWALLVKADVSRYRTAAGRAFQMEMLRSFLAEAVEGSWKVACGDPAEPVFLPPFDERPAGPGFAP